MINLVDSPEKSGAILRQALAHMTRHQIPVYPMNYAIWYVYASGRNPALNEKIEEILLSNQPFTIDANQSLFNTYILNENIGVVEEKIRSELRRVLEELSRQFIQSDGALETHKEVLATCVGQLDANPDLPGIRVIADRLLEEARSMVDSGKAIRNQLDTACKEVDQLRAELNEVKRESDTDALTGLGNRRAFDQAIAEGVASAMATGESLSLIIVDLDNFKTINDTHGHLMGDNVLRRTAQMLKKLVRGDDLVCRYGGDEFVVLLPKTPLAGSVKVAEKIRDHFEKKLWRIKVSGESIGSVNISVGTATYDVGESIDSFIERADQALYLSKTDGRNRVSVHLCCGSKPLSNATLCSTLLQ